MNAISTIGHNSGMTIYQAMTTDELWQAFHRAVEQTADGYRNMSFLWVELEDRGQDLSAFRNPITAFMRDIASGRLLPELLVRHCGVPALLTLLKNLSLEDQRKLNREDITVDVATGFDGDRLLTTAVNVSTMPIPKARLVFGGGTIRTPEEQVQYMPKPPANPAPVRTRGGSDVIDPTGQDLMAALQLTRKQGSDLHAAALRQGVTVPELVKAALITAKIIKA